MTPVSCPARSSNATVLRRLLSSARETPHYARWLIAATLGLRQGEVLGLRWDDVDLGKSQLHVRQALQRRSGGALELVEPKTARSRRTIPLPAHVLHALAEHRDRQSAARDKAGDDWTERGFVFTTRTGGPLAPRNDYRSFQLLLTKAGLRRVRVHDLRHTAASMLLEQGVHPASGHGDPRPLADQPDHEYLLPCGPGQRPRGHRRRSGGAVEHGLSRPRLPDRLPPPGNCPSRRVPPRSNRPLTCDDARTACGV